ncbi:MAG: LysE family translocator [Cyanobacteria bacterium P01_D01_bin.2]
MSFSSILTLFGTMFVLAIIPSPSVFAVVARSVASGFIHGAITSVGIVVGDFIFILLAIVGLWTIAETAGSVFFLVKYAGAAYLIYLGITPWLSKPRHTQEIEDLKEVSWLSNFMCGLLITLSDPKAVLFYAGFLPAYLDLSSISGAETGIVLLSATVAVGSAKLMYAYLADRARLLFRHGWVQTAINILASSVMIGTGIFLAAGV